MMLFAFWLILIPVCSVLHISSALWAGEVVQVVPMNFGTVIINPAGCVVTLDAKKGETEPTASNAVVYGGASGKLTIRAQAAEQVLVEYHDSVTLWASNDTVVVDGVQSHSQYNNQYINLDGGNVPMDIHIGGRLILDGDETITSYSGTLKVELTFSVL